MVNRYLGQTGEMVPAMSADEISCGVPKLQRPISGASSTTAVERGWLPVQAARKATFRTCPASSERATVFRNRMDVEEAGAVPAAGGLIGYFCGLSDPDMNATSSSSSHYKSIGWTGSYLRRLYWSGRLVF